MSENRPHFSGTCLSVDNIQVGPRPIAKDLGGGWRICGRLDLVEGVMTSSHLLLSAKLAKGDDGLFLLSLDSDGVERCRARYIDAAQLAGTVSLDDVPAHRLSCNCGDLLQDVELLGRVLTAAELLGASDAFLDHTCSFVRQRKQFGKAIGDFQAVAHSCAEMYGDIELIRSMLYATAVCHDGNGIPAAVTAAQAKALAAEMAGIVSEKGLHLFGAEGLRWHRGVHFLMRRIKGLQVIFGDQMACEEIIVDSWQRKNTLEANGAYL